MTESFTFVSLPEGRARRAAVGKPDDGQPSYSGRIVYLSSHLVITVIMVWRQWVRCTATLRFAVDEAAPMVDLLRWIGD
jgi:hypothetical protein